MAELEETLAVFAVEIPPYWPCPSRSGRALGFPEVTSLYQVK